MTLTFTVLGKSETKGSARAFMRKGAKFPVVVNDNPKAKEWQRRIADEAARVLAESKQQPFGDGPIAMDIGFYLQRPKRFLIAKWAHVDVPCLTTPDFDKAVRVVADALSGLVYRDDRQVVKADIHKHYCAAGEVPRCEITVTALAVAQPHIKFTRPTLFGEEAPYATTAGR